VARTCRRSARAGSASTSSIRSTCRSDRSSISRYRPRSTGS
jgi:hypothetical protein